MSPTNFALQLWYNLPTRPERFSRLKARISVTKATTTELMMKGTFVPVSKMFGMAQRAYRGAFIIIRLNNNLYLVEEHVDRVEDTHCTICQRQVENANICEQHHILSQSGRNSALSYCSPSELLFHVSLRHRSI